MESTIPESAGRRGGSSECGRPELALRLAAGEEVSGTFGAEITAHAASCAPCSVRLSLLQQAERWLAEEASSNRGGIRVATACPSAEELFDFGRGLGARELALGVERRVEAHLVECGDCRALVATLASRPPTPLLHGTSEAPAAPRTTLPRPMAPATAPRSTQRPAARRRWLQFAAAAAVVLGALYWWDSTRASHGKERGDFARNDSQLSAITYPTAQLLRGDSSSALCFPRARVLAASPAGTAGAWHPLRFVIAAHPRAEMYRVELSRAPQGAFGRGELLQSLESPQPEFDASSGAGAALPVGRYTWEAWARVNGLEHSLGRRDFEVVESPAAREALAQRERLSEPDRSSAILLWLVENGFATDARAYALGLAPSTARDAFLSAVPGR